MPDCLVSYLQGKTPKQGNPSLLQQEDAVPNK